MQTGRNHGRTTWPHDDRMAAAWGKWMMACMVSVVVAGPWALAQSPQQPGTSQPRHTLILPIANRVPDANQQMEMNQRQARKANFDAVNAERKRELTDESALLLQMASELKAEVDKNANGALSEDERRQADAIAKLARMVQDKMKLTVHADY